MEKQQKILEMAKDVCRAKLNCNDVCNPISACDALKYAERAVEAGYSKPEWISVDERFPKHRDKVLVCDERRNMVTAMYIAYDNGGFDWCTSVRLVYKVTHWMPLPEAPKGGAK